MVTLLTLLSIHCAVLDSRLFDLEARTRTSVSASKPVQQFPDLIGPFNWDGATIPRQGRTYSKRFEPIVDRIERMMRSLGLPGCSFTLLDSRGEEVISLGFGYMEVEGEKRFTPDTLCRIGSVSKLFTELAAEQLAHDGRIALNMPVVDYLGIEPISQDGSPIDPRVKSVTIQHLIDHKWGNKGRAEDMTRYYDRRTAKQFHLAMPVSRKDALRLLFGERLVTDPGSVEAYSNWGYNVLAEVIEKASRTNYENAVHMHVFKYLGIGRNDAKVTDGTVKGRDPREAFYYGDKQRPTDNAYIGGDTPVMTATQQYGYLNYNLYQGATGWIMSTRTMAKVGFRVKQLLHEVRQMSGSVWGAEALLRPYPDGVTWAFVTNYRAKSGEATKNQPSWKFILAELEAVVESLRGDGSSSFDPNP